MGDAVFLTAASTIGIILAIAMFLALMRLFSIDRTLKLILAELKMNGSRMLTLESVSRNKT